MRQKLLPPPPPAGGAGGLGSSLGGGLGGGSLGGLGGLGGGGAPPLGGGGLGGLGGPGGASAQPGQQPPETKFINVDDVWHALRDAVKDMEDYPELKLKTSSRRKNKDKSERKSSLETGG